jgi:hypothetical protein
VRAAEDECKRTLAGNNDEPIKDRVRKMVAGFSKLGVTAAMIEARLGHSLDAVLPEELGELRTIFTSIKSGVTKAGEWFGGAKPERETAADVLDEAAPAPAGKPTTKKAKPAPAPEPQPEEPSDEAPIATAQDDDIFG